MRTTISTIQKSCVFAGAALCGSLCIGAPLWQELTADPTHRLTRGDVTFTIALGWLLLCFLVFAMVYGAWFGSIFCVLWRSPPGCRWFWTFSGGIGAGTLGTVAGTYWSLLREGPLSRGQRLADVIVMGVLILLSTLAGLLLGNLIGHRRERSALAAVLSPLQDQG